MTLNISKKFDLPYLGRLGEYFPNNVVLWALKIKLLDNSPPPSHAIYRHSSMENILLYYFSITLIESITNRNDLTNFYENLCEC